MSKGGTEIIQACDSCQMPGFCASIVLAFILGVELSHYMVDGGNLQEPGLGEKTK